MCPVTVGSCFSRCGDAVMPITITVSWPSSLDEWPHLPFPPRTSTFEVNPHACRLRVDVKKIGQRARPYAGTSPYLDSSVK